MNKCFLSAFEPGDTPALARLYTDSRVRQFLGGPVDEATAPERGLMEFRSTPRLTASASRWERFSDERSVLWPESEGACWCLRCKSSRA